MDTVRTWHYNCNQVLSNSTHTSAVWILGWTSTFAACPNNSWRSIQLIPNAAVRLLRRINERDHNSWLHFSGCPSYPEQMSFSWPAGLSVAKLRACYHPSRPVSECWFACGSQNLWKENGWLRPLGDGLSLTSIYELASCSSSGASLQFFCHLSSFWGRGYMPSLSSPLLLVLRSGWRS